MTPSEYQKAALTKMADQQIIHDRMAMLPAKMTQLDNGARGVAEEAGEIQAVVKRHLEYGKPLDRDRLIDECGDVLWRVAQTLDSVGATLSEAMEKNLAKLGVRYKDGFTNDEAADENRDRAAEAAAVDAPRFKDLNGASGYRDKDGNLVRYTSQTHADQTAHMIPVLSTAPGKNEKIIKMFERCDVPPRGWKCSRPLGHEGPCAATPDDDNGFVPEKRLPPTTDTESK